NGFANNGRGQLRMHLDQATAIDPCEQARATTTDWSGRLKSCYGSEGWGFESLRARPAQRPVPILGPAFCVLRTATLTAKEVHRRPSSPWSSSWSSQSLSRRSASLVTLSGTCV